MIQNRIVMAIVIGMVALALILLWYSIESMKSCTIAVEYIQKTGSVDDVCTGTCAVCDMLIDGGILGKR